MSSVMPFLENIYSLYRAGKSIPEVSAKVGKSRSTVRYHLHKAGYLRSRKEGVQAAAKEGKLSKNKGVKRPPFTKEWKAAISTARLRWAKENAKGFSAKTNGYIEYTRGEHKHRSEHVVAMEKRLGRKLLPDECVHHIDGNKHNNNPNNLALMTRSGHMRHHKMIERISK